MNDGRSRTTAPELAMQSAALLRTCLGAGSKAIPNPRLISRSYGALEFDREELPFGTLPPELYSFETLVHLDLVVQAGLTNGPFSMNEVLSMDRPTALDARELVERSIGSDCRASIPA